MVAAVPTIVRFWKKVDTSGPCWIWTGRCDPDGYGVIKLSRTKTTVRAHRYAFELFNGPIDFDVVVCHTCDRPSCVNPAHLYAGTHKTNAADKVARGRWKNGYVDATECKHGHPFDEENTYRNKQGERICRACSRRRTATYKQRKAVQS